MPSKENLKESPESSTEDSQVLTLEGQDVGLHNRLVEEINLEKKREMARELLTTGLSPQAIKRILNLSAERDVFEDKEQKI